MRYVNRKRHHLIPLLVAATGAIGLSNGETLAACVQNDAGRNLFVAMTSDMGRIERSFLVSDKICQAVPDDMHVRVSILPYGGARFGCRTDLVGDEETSLVRFSTMNKCDFKAVE